MTESVQIALIGACALLLSGITSAVIAYLGFRITLKTSTQANQEIAAISRSNSEDIIRFQSRAKLAEMRQQWIEELRIRLADFSSYSSRHFLSLLREEAYPGPHLQDAYGYVLLKLNPKETISKELFLVMGKIGALVNNTIRDVDAARK